MHILIWMFILYLIYTRPVDILAKPINFVKYSITSPSTPEEAVRKLQLFKKVQELLQRLRRHQNEEKEIKRDIQEVLSFLNNAEKNAVDKESRSNAPNGYHSNCICKKPTLRDNLEKLNLEADQINAVMKMISSMSKIHNEEENGVLGVNSTSSRKTDIESKNGNDKDLNENINNSPPNFLLKTNNELTSNRENYLKEELNKVLSSIAHYLQRSKAVNGMRISK